MQFSKSKTILIVVLLLAAALVLANNIYSNKMEKEIDAQFRAKIEKLETGAEVAYSGIKVNALRSKVKIIDFTISDEQGKAVAKCRSIDVDIPYEEALDLLDNDKFEEIRSLKLTFVDPEIILDKTKFSMHDLTLDFKGHLTAEDFKNIQDRFPGEKQELEMSFSKFKMKLPEGAKVMPPFSGIQDQFTELDKGSYKLAFLPQENKISIQEFSLESPIISYQGSTSISYGGNGLKDFQPKAAEMNTSLLFQPKDFEWEAKDGSKGEFSLKKLYFATNSRTEFGSKIWPEGEMVLEVEDLHLYYGDAKKSKASSPMNINLNDMDIKKLVMNYELQDGKLNISDTELESSVADASVFADITLNQASPAMSEINEAVLKVKNMSPQLAEMIGMFEKQMGKELPREDGTIVLELSGKMAKPKIKGFEY